MKKIIPGDSWDFGDLGTQLIKLSSRGLRGDDRRAFVEKRAASHAFVDYLDKISFHPGEIPIHKLAIGATEGYGANRNSDGFSEKDCREHHPTFVKFAYYYRHHKNKDPKKSYGVIKASAYNEKMKRVELLIAGNGTKEAAERNGGLVLPDKSIERLEQGEDVPGSMACFTDPTFPILTRDRGYIGIAELNTDDFVWTHEGRWRPVLKLIHRKYTGLVTKLSVRGLPVPLEITSDHPMLARIFSDREESELIAAGSVFVSHDSTRKERRDYRNIDEFESVETDWSCAEHLQEGDRLFYQSIDRYPGYGAIDCTYLASLMGYFLAEGCCLHNQYTSIRKGGEKQKSVFGISFCCHIDDSAVRNIPKILMTLYPDITVTIKLHRKSKQSVILNVYNAHLGRFFMQMMGHGAKRKKIPPEIFNASEDVKKSFLGSWLDGDGFADVKGMHWSTSSRNLALQGRDLLASIGISSSIYRIQHGKCETSGYANSGDEYTLNISKFERNSLADYATKADKIAVSAKRSKPASMRVCQDGTYAYRITASEKRYVEDIDVYNIEVAEDQSYSAAGLISHNCHVRFDICSICNNKSASRREYCDEDSCVDPKTGIHGFGCKDGLGKVANDGRVQFVDNPRPRFFDFSEVTSPADRIAYGMRATYLDGTKQASDSIIGGAELAERMDLLFPDEEHYSRCHVLQQLCDCEASLEHSEKLASYGMVCRITADLAVKIAENEPSLRSPERLAALAKQGCVLPLPLFLAIHTPGNVEPQEIEQLVEKTAAASIGIFKKLQDNWSRGEDWPFALPLPGNCAINGTLRKLSSFQPRDVRDRIFDGVISGAVNKEIRASPDGAYKLASVYAAYLVEAARIAEEQGLQLDLDALTATTKVF